MMEIMNNDALDAMVNIAYNGLKAFRNTRKSIRYKTLIIELISVPEKCFPK